MHFAFLHRLLSLADRFGGQRRIEVCPPALLQGSGIGSSTWRYDVLAWLDRGWTRQPFSAAGVSEQVPRRREVNSPRFCRIRDEFSRTTHDIGTQQAGLLQQRIAIARSLRELWHLRPEVFKLVALQFSQAEAQCRLDRLNRHFPTRSPRSGFASLDQ